MTDDDRRFMDEVFEVEEAAEKVRSGEDFINFLAVLEKGILEDDEVHEKLQLVFLRVVERKLKFAAKFPGYDLDIEMPEHPDWNWVARLFFVGAFEN